MSFIEGIGTDPGQYLQDRAAAEAEYAKRHEALELSMAHARQERETEAAAKAAAESALFDEAVAKREAETRQVLARVGLASTVELPDLQQLYDRANAVVDQTDGYTSVHRTNGRHHRRLGYSNGVLLAEEGSLQQVVSFSTVGGREGKRAPFEPVSVEYKTRLLDRSYDGQGWFLGAPYKSTGSMIVNGESVNTAIISGEEVTVPTIVKINERRTDLPPTLEIAKMHWVLKLAEEQLG